MARGRIINESILEHEDKTPAPESGPGFVSYAVTDPETGVSRPIVERIPLRNKGFVEYEVIDPETGIRRTVIERT